MSTQLIQALHAGIRRRDWSEVETAANRLRDEAKFVVEPPPEHHVEGEIERIVQSVNEWDDRTSHDDYFEHLLITSEELVDILRNFADTLGGRKDG